MSTSICPATCKPAEYASDSDRITWWRDAKLGLFIHWGVYSALGGEWQGQAAPGMAEHIRNNARIPRDEYAKLARNFNPAGYDPREWMELARGAGM